MYLLNWIIDRITSDKTAEEVYMGFTDLPPIRERRPGHKNKKGFLCSNDLGKDLKMRKHRAAEPQEKKVEQVLEAQSKKAIKARLQEHKRAEEQQKRYSLRLKKK